MDCTDLTNTIAGALSASALGEVFSSLVPLLRSMQRKRACKVLLNLYNPYNVNNSFAIIYNKLMKGMVYGMKIRNKDRLDKEIQDKDVHGEEIKGKYTQEENIQDMELNDIDQNNEKHKEKHKDKNNPPMDKVKKKKIIKRGIIIGITTIIMLFIIINSVAAKNRAPIVYTKEVARQDIEQTLSTSGTVQTLNTKVYFSQVESKVGHINVAVGDIVKKGDVLFTYDEKALADEKQLAQLKLQSGEGGYKSSVDKNNKYISKLNEANVNLGVLRQQIEDSENYVNQLNQKITDKQNALAYEGTLLQISLMEIQEGMETKKASEEELKEDSEKCLELQKQIQYNSYEQQHNKDIETWRKEVSKYEEIIAGYKEYEAEMKSQKSVSEDAVMDGGSKEQLEADTKSAGINANETIAAVEAVQNGVTADFDGVVTELSIVEGGAFAKGEKLLTLASTDEVKVGISVSKYDLEKIKTGQDAAITIAGKAYKGSVEKINGMATTNASGAAVVGADIRVKDPDSGIFLGVEAKVTVNTASVKQAVAVPLEVVNSDKDGDFVYAVENGILTKKRIKAGISSDSYCEVLEGLDEGAQVVSDVSLDMEEGMAVTAVPEA